MTLTYTEHRDGRISVGDGSVTTVYGSRAELGALVSAGTAALLARHYAADPTDVIRRATVDVVVTEDGGR